MSTKSRSKRIWIVLGGLAFVLVTVSICLITMVRREWAYICVNTGSRMGYTEWITRNQTQKWQWESPLETFIKTEHPEMLRHEWVSYAGTGRNIFGMKVLHGHGRRGPIYTMSKDDFTDWIGQLTESEKLEVYVALSSGDRDRVGQVIDQGWDRVLSSMKRKKD